MDRPPEESCKTQIPLKGSTAVRLRLCSWEVLESLEAAEELKYKLANIQISVLPCKLPLPASSGEKSVKLG